MDNEQNTHEAAACGAEAAASGGEPVPDIILASGSPRRKQLLEDAGIAFSVRVSEVDETLEPDLLADPPEAAKKLAERKAGAVVQEVLSENYLGMAAVLGADTMVVLDGEIFGKPVSLSDAKRMLRRLSGRTHEVITAVSLWMVAAPAIEDISVGFRTFVDRSAVTPTRRSPTTCGRASRSTRQAPTPCKGRGRALWSASTAPWTRLSACPSAACWTSSRTCSPRADGWLTKTKPLVFSTYTPCSRGEM